MNLDFPGFSENNVPSFPNGEIVNITATNFRSPIVKVGAKTGLTIGSLRYCDAHAMIVNDHWISIDDQRNKFVIRVHGQIEVIPRIDPTNVADERQPFLTHRDSGSFVFMIVQDNPPVLRCATAVTSFGSCLMTPIVTVLTDLGLSCDCLSKFERPKIYIRDSKKSNKDDVIIEMLRDIKRDVQLQKGEIREIKTQLAATNEEVRDLKNKFNQ